MHCFIFNRMILLSFLNSLKAVMTHNWHGRKRNILEKRLKQYPQCRTVKVSFCFIVVLTWLRHAGSKQEFRVANTVKVSMLKKLWIKTNWLKSLWRLWIWSQGESLLSLRHRRHKSLCFWFKLRSHRAKQKSMLYYWTKWHL